jgi:hypothetical protein
LSGGEQDARDQPGADVRLARCSTTLAGLSRRIVERMLVHQEICRAAATVC